MSGDRDPTPPAAENPGLWREADRVLDALLDLDPGERPAALSALAPDPRVRERVARMLASDSALGADLETARARTARRAHAQFARQAAAGGWTERSGAAACRWSSPPRTRAIPAAARQSSC